MSFLLHFLWKANFERIAKMKFQDKAMKSNFCCFAKILAEILEQRAHSWSLREIARHLSSIFKHDAPEAIFDFFKIWKNCCLVLLHVTPFSRFAFHFWRRRFCFWRFLLPLCLAFIRWRVPALQNLPKPFYVNRFTGSPEKCLKILTCLFLRCSVESWLCHKFWWRFGPLQIFFLDLVVQSCVDSILWHFLKVAWGRPLVVEYWVKRKNVSVT